MTTRRLVTTILLGAATAGALIAVGAATVPVVFAGRGSEGLFILPWVVGVGLVLGLSVGLGVVLALIAAKKLRALSGRPLATGAIAGTGALPGAVLIAAVLRWNVLVVLPLIYLAAACAVTLLLIVVGRSGHRASSVRNS